MNKKKAATYFDNEKSLYFSQRLKKALANMFDNPLTVIEAPMGYGKTLAAKTFLTNASVKVVWTTAQASGSKTFWSDFCKELDQVIPQSSKDISELNQLGFPEDQARTVEGLKIFQRIPFPKKTVLVFDDCHLLPRSFISFCENLAAETFLNVSIVAITRNSWGEGERLINSQNSLSRIDQSLLALNSSEIAEYFELNGVTISPDVALQLHENTSGWISALYLSLLWFEKNGNFSSIPEDISVSLQDMVYEPLSSQAKELLLVLAPLERFTIAQAVRLYGSDAPLLLAELTTKNAFVFFDRLHQVYFPHAVFRQLIQKIFKGNVLTEVRRREIYRACGDEFMAAGELASAMEAWYLAGDFERALTVLESDMTLNLVTERAELYIEMFKHCPQDIMERHLGAWFKYAIALFSAGDFTSFENQLRWLAERCACLDQGQEANRWLGELQVLLALTKFNDIEAMSAHFKKALTLLKEPTILYGTDFPWTLGSPSVLFMFHRQSGILDEELLQMRSNMPSYYQLSSHHGAGAEYLMEAEAFYYRGEPNQAEALCQKALEMSWHHNQLGNVICAYFIQMRLAIMKGDFEIIFGGGQKSGLLYEMRSLIARSRDFFMLHTADLCEGWLYASLSLYEKIPLWLTTKLDWDGRLYTFAKGFYPIVYGRAQLLAGKYADVIEELGVLLAGDTFKKNLLFSIYLRIYISAALHKLGRIPEALENLTLALDSALPDSLYLPFVENQDFIGHLLSRIQTKRKHEPFQTRQEEVADVYQAGREEILNVIEGRKSILNLTQRELETLRFLAAGFSTTQTAEKMEVSVHTVRAHLKSASRKTGAKTRVALLQIFSKKF
ncbi:MAG: LuxR C-terminal-related transcriptional regulator [Deltaproteobacteria bacterium]|jgi:LuxR family maltose regulon positive regulatory protein|nr:LuxR C-terminal-related transcriptional regulator [Deltaproteobacteria bacterium]